MDNGPNRRKVRRVQEATDVERSSMRGSVAEGRPRVLRVAVGGVVGREVVDHIEPVTSMYWAERQCNGVAG